MTISEGEALRLLRETFRNAPAQVKKTLRAHADVPMRASEVPGWAYFAVGDRVEYTGEVVGGN